MTHERVTRGNVPKARSGGRGEARRSEDRTRGAREGLRDGGEGSATGGKRFDAGMSLWGGVCEGVRDGRGALGDGNDGIFAVAEGAGAWRSGSRRRTSASGAGRSAWRRERSGWRRARGRWGEGEGVRGAGGGARAGAGGGASGGVGGGGGWSALLLGSGPAEERGAQLLKRTIRGGVLQAGLDHLESCGLLLEADEEIGDVAARG